MAPTTTPVRLQSINRSGAYVAAEDALLYGAKPAGAEDMFALALKRGDAVLWQGSDGMGNEYVSVNGRDWLLPSDQLEAIVVSR